MGTTMSRLARAAVAVGAVVLTVSGVMVVQAPAASAGGCSAGLVCGAVKNRTGRLMSYTTDLDANPAHGSGSCERFSRIGTWHWRARGVWTKVRDPEIADCGIGDGNEIWCTVLVQ